jgi:indolepyruvate ferredoxin oxidoreductase beta subunit
VQGTSIPGVAQRTGATTYYIEIFPVPHAALGGRRPVFALYPGVGDLDVMLASEFAEAARAAARGFVTPDRTLLIASTHRVYAIDERGAPGDGRYDDAKLAEAARTRAHRALLDDLRRLAERHQASLNAVLLGTLAASGALPVPRAAFEDAIRDSFVAVDANLRGFAVGFGHRFPDAPPERVPDASAKRAAPAGPQDLERVTVAMFPQTAAAMAREGLRRLTGYQGSRYAAQYLERLETVWRAESAAGGDGRLTREAARELAVRMSYEDVIRVAQLKSAPARFARVRAEAQARAGEPVLVVDYFKPGLDELASILPPLLARPLLTLADRLGWRRRLHLAMRVKANSINGYLRLRLLAGLRRWRPFTWRWQEEQRAIESWLADIRTACAIDPALAQEIVACARLVKGYGDTHRRGMENFERIRTALIAPALDGRLNPARAIDAIASARIAAQTDPEGDRLSRALAQFEASSAAGPDLPPHG